MGAAFLVALRGHQVVEVDHRLITMVARTAARVRVFRSEPDPEAVLAWTLCDRAPSEVAERARPDE
jgi:hypothetical protein